MRWSSEPSEQAARKGTGLVAFVDITGFIAVIEALPSIEALWQEMRNMRFLAGGLLGRNAIHDDEHMSGLIFVGDAFLAYAFDPTDEIRESFVRNICALSGAMLHRGWRIRAGIAEGELLVSDDRTHYLGRALARAHTIESQQEWFGGAIDNALSPWFEDTDSGQRLLAERIVVRTNIPFKRGSEQSDLALGWPRSTSLDEPSLRHNLELAYPPPKDPKIEEMLESTLEFFRNFKGET